MKLLPVTLTLFDKATNITYKGTLLLKNLDAVDEGQKNRTMLLEGDQGDEYDGKGAGLFIILVVSMYALSIVLFIASFITKKPNAGETSDENTVNTYLHKVGDLKEKTARDHFKKLKMSITSKMEMDSENQKRGRVNSKGTKEIKSMSRTSSKSSLTELGVLPLGARIRSTEAISSTGLLPKEDDATEPLLSSGNLDLPITLVLPGQEVLGPAGRISPSLRRATSARLLSVIREMPDIEASSDVSPQVGRTVSYHDVSYSTHTRGAPSFPKSWSEPENTLVKKVGSSEDMPDQVSASAEQQPGGQLNTEGNGSRTSLFKPVPKRSSSEHVNIQMDMTGPEDDDKICYSNEKGPPQNGATDELTPIHHLSHVERPRPRYTIRPIDHGEEVWQQMPQRPLPPPPPRRSSQKPSNLHVQMPARPGGSDIWVLRNGRSEIRERTPEGWVHALEVGEHRDGQKRMQSPNHIKHALEDPRDHRQADSGYTRRGKSPIDKSPRDRSPSDKSPRDKSPRDKSPRDKSPRDRSVSNKPSKDRSRCDGSQRDKSPRDTSPRDRSPRDWSPRDWSPRDWSPRDRSPRGARDPSDTYPYDACSLPLPFRSPSPRSPSRPPKDRCIPSQTHTSKLASMRPGTTQPDAAPGGLRDHKATLRVTLDRSPEPMEGDPYGCSTNKAFEQSPRLASTPRQYTAAVHGDTGRAPPRVSFTDGPGTVASLLQVPQPCFPVTFNSPGVPRRSPEKDPYGQISKV